MDDRNVIFSSHAIKRMFSRRISETDVTTAIAQGTIIESYPDDSPFPSYLTLDFINNRPTHVVYLIDESTNTYYIITTYVPDPTIWQNNFSSRK